jgi:hypothetical protein
MRQTDRMIQAAGFGIVEVHRPGRWYEVTAPDGEHGAILKQSEACWHFFARDVAATASHSDVARCHLGGLGDAIGTDGQLKTYRQLLSEPNVPAALRSYRGVHAAMTQACADD